MGWIYCPRLKGRSGCTGPGQAFSHSTEPSLSGGAVYSPAHLVCSRHTTGLPPAPASTPPPQGATGRAALRQGHGHTSPPHSKQEVPGHTPTGAWHPQQRTEGPRTGQGMSLTLQEPCWGPRSRPGPDTPCGNHVPGAKGSPPARHTDRIPSGHVAGRQGRGWVCPQARPLIWRWAGAERALSSVLCPPR